jgi:hypothetical protein
MCHSFFAEQNPAMRENRYIRDATAVVHMKNTDLIAGEGFEFLCKRLAVDKHLFFLAKF